MGVERAVTCWYAHHQVIQLEIARLQTLLEPSQEAKLAPKEAAEAEHQLALAQASLLNLGPCPRPMMG